MKLEWEPIVNLEMSKILLAYILPEMNADVLTMNIPARKIVCIVYRSVNSVTLLLICCEPNIYFTFFSPGHLCSIFFIELVASRAIAAMNARYPLLTSVSPLDEMALAI